MKASILKNQIINSPLQLQKRIQASGASPKGKSLSFVMNLTTLIDAFCILVIFLLSNMNGQLQHFQLGKSLILPSAMKTEILSPGVQIKFEKESLFVDEKATSFEDLTKKLIALKAENKNHLVIQADRNSDFEKISLLLRAGGQAGFDKYSFAVLPGFK